MPNRVNEAINDLKKLYGIDEYCSMTNICFGDNYFAAHIKDKYTKEELAEAEAYIKTYLKGKEVL